ncbi:MAG: hypothetical protein AB7L92_02370 [Alphaproteobacteria bacterium]
MKSGLLLAAAFISISSASMAQSAIGLGGMRGYDALACPATGNICRQDRHNTTAGQECSLNDKGAMKCYCDHESPLQTGMGKWQCRPVQVYG